MNIHNFVELIQETKVKRPKIFSLDADCKANAEDICMIEAYYDLQLPSSYKEFLMQFGGGYFAFVVVYSLDAHSDFFLKKNADPEFVKANNFLPVVDFETGDLAGFRIVNGACEAQMSLFNHDEQAITDLGLDFFDVLAEYGLNID